MFTLKLPSLILNRIRQHLSLLLHIRNLLIRPRHVLFVVIKYMILRFQISNCQLELLDLCFLSFFKIVELLREVAQHLLLFLLVRGFNPTYFGF
jgi:hypothetical protein